MMWIKLANTPIYENFDYIYIYSHGDFALQDNLYSFSLTSLEEICRTQEVVNNLHIKLSDKMLKNL